LKFYSLFCSVQLSVVILNYNVRYFLEQCLLSVVRAMEGIDGEIIVVDNASPDGSVEMVRRHFPQATLIANTENSGFPKGNNLGVAQAKGEYLCILNPDTVVAEDTFRKALGFAGSKKNLGILGVRLIDGAGRFLPESKRGVPTPFVAFTKIAGWHKFGGFFNRYYAGHLGEGGSGKVDVLVGAFMLMKAETYRAAGGFDENCFMYSDDIDLSYTVLKSGKENYYFGGAAIIHYKGESTAKDAAYLNRFREAMDYFYRKHFRRSPVFDAMMKAGALLFAAIKKNQSPKPVRPKAYLLFSNDEELRSGIEKKVGNPVSILPANNISDVEIAPGTQVFFDSSQLSYGEIIQTMQTRKTQRLTFRIAYPDQGFFIGSDSPDDRGQAVIFAGGTDQSGGIQADRR
jgi:GT2 family glycosyltransferase